MNEPAELTYAQCRELLHDGSVGRVALNTPDGPHIVPVNYRVVEDSIVLRTTPYSVLGTYGPNSRVAFEVDEIDGELERGWSVVATGQGQMIEDPEELSRVRTFFDPKPWAGGIRRFYIRIRWEELTGRRVGNGWPQSSSNPLRRVL